MLFFATRMDLGYHDMTPKLSFKLKKYIKKKDKMSIQMCVFFLACSVSAKVKLIAYKMDDVYNQMHSS